MAVFQYVEFKMEMSRKIVKIVLTKAMFVITNFDISVPLWIFTGIISSNYSKWLIILHPLHLKWTYTYHLCLKMKNIVPLSATKIFLVEWMSCHPTLIDTLSIGLQYLYTWRTLKRLSGPKLVQSRTTSKGFLSNGLRVRRMWYMSCSKSISEHLHWWEKKNTKWIVRS